MFAPQAGGLYRGDRLMSAKAIAKLGMMIALAMILSYVESMIPLSFAVPGIKMGLPNIVIVFALYRLDAGSAVGISLLRVVLISILFGNGASLIYAASGAVLSLMVMVLLKHFNRYRMITVSVCGAVAHNIGQILAAVVVLGTDKIFYYLPVLMVSGVITGALIGAVAALVLKKIKNW